MKTLMKALLEVTIQAIYVMAVIAIIGDETWTNDIIALFGKADAYVVGLIMWVIVISLIALVVRLVALLLSGTACVRVSMNVYRIQLLFVCILQMAMMWYGNRHKEW